MDPWKAKLSLDALDERIVPDATPIVTYADGHTSGAVIAAYDFGSGYGGGDTSGYGSGSGSGYGSGSGSNGDVVVASGSGSGSGSGYGSGSGSGSGSGNATTVTTLAAATDSPQSQNQAANLVLTATVTGSSAQPLTGSVSFSDNGVVVGMATVGAGGVATWTVVNPTAGLHVLTASYKGGFDNDASISNSVGLTLDTGFGTGPGSGTLPVNGWTVPVTVTVVPVPIGLLPPPPSTSDDALNQRLGALGIQQLALEAILFAADLRLAIAEAGVVSATRAAIAGVDPDAGVKFELALKEQFDAQQYRDGIRKSLDEVNSQIGAIQDLQTRRQQGGPGNPSDTRQI